MNVQQKPLTATDFAYVGLPAPSVRFLLVQWPHAFVGSYIKALYCTGDIA